MCWLHWWQVPLDHAKCDPGERDEAYMRQCTHCLHDKVIRTKGWCLISSDFNLKLISGRSALRCKDNSL